MPNSSGSAECEASAPTGRPAALLWLAHFAAATQKVAEVARLRAVHPNSGEFGYNQERSLEWRSYAWVCGWPPGFFENVVGSIDDEAFRRYPQGEYEKREEFSRVPERNDREVP